VLRRAVARHQTKRIPLLQESHRLGALSRSGPTLVAAATAAAAAAAQVAADEASHFSALNERLAAVGSHYGALPAHDGLWESAQKTAHSLPARLAVEHCVHEARGLDVLPTTVHKFRSNGDAESAALLEDVIYAVSCYSSCG
jgi:uncharacterized ferritin-like protein (DUF455 family)